MEKTYKFNGRNIPKATMFTPSVGQDYKKGVKLERLLKLKSYPNEPTKKEVSITVNGITKVFTWSKGEYRNGKQTDIEYLLTFKEQTKVTII